MFPESADGADGADGADVTLRFILCVNPTHQARALKREELPVLQKKFHSPAVHSQISSLWDVEVKTSNKPSLHSVRNECGCVCGFADVCGAWIWECRCVLPSKLTPLT